MTRLELLKLALARARSNGFEFRRWYTTRLGLPWISTEAAITLLDTQRRYYALVFSHEFASTFWMPGVPITYEVPPQTFRQPMKNGTIRTIQRKPFIRRSVSSTAWRYHLKQMALAEDPLRHLRKYMHIEETLDPEPDTAKPSRKRSGTGPETPVTPIKGAKKAAAKKGSAPRPMPTGRPAFLQRPYKGSLPG